MKRKFKLNDKPLSSEELLKKFMKEFFPFSAMRQAGLFTKEMKGDYKAQSEKMCKFLGLETIYEYRKEELRCHISSTGKRSKDEPFITVIPSIYE